MFAVMYAGVPLKDAEGKVLVFASRQEADVFRSAGNYPGSSLMPVVVWNGSLIFVFDPPEETTDDRVPTT